MTARLPVEFTEITALGNRKRVGNEVQFSSAFLLVLATAIANAQKLVPTDPGTANGERLEVDDTAGGVQFTTVFDADTTDITWSVEPGGPIIVTFDDSTPSAVNGHILYPRDRDTWSVETAQAAKFLRSTANNGYIQISQFKPRS